MKKFMKTFALAAVAALGAVSCTENMADDTIKPNSEGVTIFATTPSEETSTRVSFEDKDGDGIALSWEAGDSFKLYNGDTYVDTFTTALGDGKFTSKDSDLELKNGVTYTAKYNEDVDIYNQNGDEINNLDAACQMEATYIPGTDSSISFAHTKAIMTFEFKSEERPDYLVFENGDESYKVTYSNLEPDAEGLYTSHIMINPCEATERTLTFSLYDSKGTAYDVRSVETDNAYVAGKRYTAPISNLAMSNYWTDYAADSFADGDGSADTPYKIATAEQFAKIAVDVNAGTTTYSDTYFELTNNIDLSAHEWVAIGKSSNYSFCGTFDGGDNSISGLYINQPDIWGQGLFGWIYNGATVKNIGVASGKVTGKSHVGGVVGRSSQSSVDNCYNKAVVISNSSISSVYVGGVVGHSYCSYITKCYNSGTVTAENGGNVGGVVGYNYYSSSLEVPLSYVKDCYNTAEATVTGGDEFVGGVVGKNMYATIANCYNNAAVISSYSNYRAYVGGVVGYNYIATVVNCYNSGSVTAEDGGHVGGVVGYNNAVNASNPAIVVNSYNTGVVTGSSTSASSVGGVVGIKTYYATITNCYYDKDEYKGNAVGGSSDDTSNAAKSTSEMQADGFVVELNNGAYAYNNTETAPAIKACAWEAVASGTPALDFDGVPTETKKEYSGGTGEENDPYIIKTADDLRELSDKVNADTNYAGKYFSMVNDIDLAGVEFTPIGKSHVYLFNGTFDGCFNEVSGLNVNAKYAGGLFGCIYGATIKNLGVAGEVKGERFVGGIVGYSNPLSSSIIINCYNLASVTAVSDNYDAEAGGIIADSSSDSIINCYNMGAVSATSTFYEEEVGASGSAYSGGIAGYSASAITNCYNVGEISASADCWCENGAIVGEVTSENASLITNCYWASDLSGTNCAVGAGYDNSTTNVKQMNSADMKKDDFVNVLSQNANDFNESNNYEPFAFTWAMYSDRNNGYPFITNVD